MEWNQDETIEGLVTASEVEFAVSMRGSERELLIDLVVNDFASQSNAS